MTPVLTDSKFSTNRSREENWIFYFWLWFASSGRRQRNHVSPDVEMATTATGGGLTRGAPEPAAQDLANGLLAGRTGRSDDVEKQLRRGSSPPPADDDEAPADDDEAPGESRRFLELAAICCLACASSDVGYSLFAPFYPEHATRRGLSPTLIGVIFALPMVTMLLLTPLVPRLQRALGVRLTLGASMAGQALCIFAFGFVDDLDEPSSFAAACLVLRAVLGMFSAASEVAAASILISCAPARLRPQALGWAEAARGLGAMIGPPLGGLLFQYGGFSLPFLVVGAANALAVSWPLQDIRLVRGLCTRINSIYCKHPPGLGTPPNPFIAHTITQYSVSPRPSFIAMHAIQYWC